MRKTENPIIEKEAIIAEYLTGELTYRKLAEKHNIDFRLIHSWVMKYQGKNRKPHSKPKQEQVAVLCGSLFFQ